MKKISIRIVNKDGSESTVQGYAITQHILPDAFAIHKEKPADPDQSGFFYHVTHIPSGACRAIKADSYKQAKQEFIQELQDNTELYRQVIASKERKRVAIQTSLF